MSDTRIQEQLSELTNRLDAQDEVIGQLPTKEDMEQIVRSVMISQLFKVGKTTKITIITMATIFGSLGVIGGGLKWLADAVGIGFIGR